MVPDLNGKKYSEYIFSPLCWYQVLVEQKKKKIRLRNSGEFNEPIRSLVILQLTNQKPSSIAMTSLLAFFYVCACWAAHFV